MYILNSDKSVFLHADGSILPDSHPNGPSSSIGYVIEQHNDEIATGSEDISRTTKSSNAAEYMAVLKALNHLIELDFNGWVFIKTDSKNLIGILSGESSPRCKESNVILTKIQHQLLHFEGYSITKSSSKRMNKAHFLARSGHENKQANQENL